MSSCWHYTKTAFTNISNRFVSQTGVETCIWGFALKEQQLSSESLQTSAFIFLREDPSVILSSLKQTLLGNPQTELEEHQIHSSAQRKRLISTRFQTRLWESEPGWYQQLLWKHICLFTDNFTQKWNCVIIYEPKTMLFFALRNTQNNNI